MNAPLGIIAGTGFYQLDALVDPVTRDVDTDHGTARITEGHWHGVPVVFLTRHGAGHSVPPHMVNYRANIRALADVGCQDVVAVAATGGIDTDLANGALVCVDDFLDFTRNRVNTFHDGTGPEGVVHVDVTQAYHPTIRTEILAAAATANEPIRDGGVYVAYEGPRFETPAEIRLARMVGGTVAGMTGCPEVVLAVEAGLRYANISLVVNPAAAVGVEITLEEIDAVLKDSAQRVTRILDAFVANRAAP